MILQLWGAYALLLRREIEPHNGAPVPPCDLVGWQGTNAEADLSTVE